MKGIDASPGDVFEVTREDGTKTRAITSLHGPTFCCVEGSTRPIVSARRLLVTDPESLQDVDRLLTRLNVSGAFPSALPHTMACTALQAALRDLADPKPPKPEEPTGRYAAVMDALGGEWVRLGDGPAPWMFNGSPDNRDTYSYAEIDAVEVLSRGVTA